MFNRRGMRTPLGARTLSELEEWLLHWYPGLFSAYEKSTHLQLSTRTGHVAVPDCLWFTGQHPLPAAPTKDLPNPRNPNGKTKFRHGGDRIRSCANKSTFKWSPGWWVPVNNIWSLSDKQEDVWNVPQSAFYISQCAHSKQSLLKRRPRSSHYVPSRTFWRGGPGAEPAQEYSLYSQQSFLKSRPWCWACPRVLTTFPAELFEEEVPGPSLPRSTHYVPIRAFWRAGPRAEPAQEYSLRS